ncbi:MAG: redoxin domain-containing protein [Candidatus Peribacteraceae bacterium]|nr:redoxin domain-containing protein [Candidatus Peribacteraceae bacterium]
MSITLLMTSFLAGVLTVLAPCVLPVLPVIVGGTAGTEDRRRPFVIAFSLAASVILFTLILKVSTLLIAIPQELWTIISGGIVMLFGLIMLAPEIWEKLAMKTGLSTGSQEMLGKFQPRESLLGAALLGAALGPVFSSCSPTYFLILATILPVSFAAGILYLAVYGLGLALVLLAIAYFGQRLTQRLRWSANPRGWFRRGLGLLLVLVGLAVVTGFEKKIELAVLDSGFGTTRLEENLLEKTQDDMSGKQITEKSKSMTLPKLYEAPELTGLENWLNSEPIDSLAELRGKVVLIDFWTYSCINCIRTLPYLQSWHENYLDAGLIVLGLHAPEFQFERIPENVAEAVDKFGLTYPVAQDNDFATWRAYKNHYWPAKYLIDKDGYVRYVHYGEGKYKETEEAIALLLGEEMKDVKVEATEVNFSKINTPETYLGLSRRENFISDAATLNRNEWTLTGDWDEEQERIVTVESGATLRLKFQANIANLVLGGTGSVEVLIDGVPAGSGNSGNDLADSKLTLDGERLYELANFQGEYGTHEITLNFLDAGIAAYAWTFG